MFTWIFFLAEFSCCSSESQSQAKKAEYTPPKAEGSHVCSVGKHFWKYENVHLCQTDATDKFTRRKCPCLIKNDRWNNGQTFEKLKIASFLCRKVFGPKHFKL